MHLEPKPKRRKPSEELMEVDEVPNGGIDNQAENNHSIDDLDHISDDEEGGLRLGDIYIPPAPKPALTFDTAGPRLIITHIQNHNFKSYAGTQVLGPFHKSFTSIIGPNGSGKSNVIDSMMFVFGYRASKIRSKKISVLIHSSSLHSKCNSAAVEVHFCQIIDGEGEAFTIVPGTQIVVSRTAFKDNSSFYQLNGKRVQFKEINKMLRSHGIDLEHNRFLILQGEVEQIAMMKPKGQNEHECGMLEYLEDIVGTNRFKEPIKQLEDKVEILNEQRKEKLNRVRNAETDWKRFHEPCAEAVELVNRTNAVAKMRNYVLQKYIHESRKIVSSEEKVLEELKEALAKIDEKLTKLQDELKEKRTVLNSGAEKYNDLHKQKDEATEKLQACKRKTVSVQAETTQSNKKKKNLDQLIEQEKKKLIELELVPEKNQREIVDCEKLLVKHNESKREAEQELETVMAGVRARTQGFQEQKDGLQGRLIELKRIVDEANRSHKLAESELKIYLSTEKKENDKLNNLNEAYTKAERDLQEKREAQNQLQSSMPAQERELETLKGKFQNIKKEEASVASKVRSLRAQLEESRQAMTANRSRGRVLDSLMKEKRNGNIPGIFGRLGDLGGIDTKYDVAISTCCGALDNIVVDTVETAQTAVEYLKTHNIGRATFIALDKQEHLKRYYEKKENYPESVPRLFDLIRVKDNRVLPAFYFGLRDTLVANDLEQASRIAYGRTRYRVVSLNGDVIEIAGTMSGGGRTTMRGRMSSSVQQETNEQNPAVIKDNESKLAELESKLTELRSEQAQVEDAITRLTQTVREGKKGLSKLDFELKSLTDQVPLLKNQIVQQQRKVASVKVDPAQTARLDNKMQEAAVNLEEAKANSKEVENQVQEVDKKISEQAGGKVRDLQKAVDELTKKINKVSSEMTKLKVAINTSKRNATKSKDKITQMETDLRDTEVNLENMKTQKKTLATEAANYQKIIDELEEQINEGTGGFAGIKEEINKLQQKEDKRKSERIAAAAAVGKKEKSLQEYRAREPAFRRDLKELKMENPGVEDVPNLEKPEPFKTYTTEELETADLDELRKQHEALKSRLGDQKPNLMDIREYKAKEECYLSRVQELETITLERNRIRKFRDDIAKKRLDEFNLGFSTITAKLKEMYQMITLGGDAELELVDSMNPFSEGVIFSVRPPNKSWKNISNLSGGEKTLSSLALVFALHYYKPTPLYVMDEIDAALDFKNVSIVANYIKDRTKNAQFIIISLRYNMFEVCNRLIGIYKTEDCTKSVTVENEMPDSDLDNLPNDERQVFGEAGIAA